MGLNIYSGSLKRFYAGEYERPLQGVAKSVSANYSMVTPSLESENWKVTDDHLEILKRNREFLAQEAPFTTEWDDDFETYYVEQLTYEGHSALYYVAAMIGLGRSLAPLSLAEVEQFSLNSEGLTDQQIADNPAIVFEADTIFPGSEANMSIFIGETDERLIIANLEFLEAVLLRLEDAIWAGSPKVNEWLHRGALPYNREKDIASSVMFNAEYAFAVYQNALRFAQEHGMPVALDF